MFIALLHYENGLDPVNAHLEAHRAWLAENYAAGRFLVSGRRAPRTGGVIVFRAKDLDEARALAATDPFHRAGAARYEIVEFEPSQWCALLDPALGTSPDRA